MALYIDKDGTISIVQGDSGEVVITNLDSSVNSQVYFAVQKLNRDPVGNELMVQSNFSDTVTFVLTAEFTDLLTVPKNKEYEIYQYGIKVCSENSEDTLLIINNEYGAVNQMVVYPKKVEGI